MKRDELQVDCVQVSTARITSNWVHCTLPGQPNHGRQEARAPSLQTHLNIDTQLWINTTSQLVLQGLHTATLSVKYSYMWQQKESFTVAALGHRC